MVQPASETSVRRNFDGAIVFIAHFFLRIAAYRSKFTDTIDIRYI